MISRSKFLVLFMFLLVSLVAQAQLSMKEISKMKVDQMTNEQVSEFATKYKEDGYDLDQVEQAAINGGMPALEWKKLRNRIENLNSKDQAKGYEHPEDMTRTVQQEIKGERKEIAEEKTDSERMIPIFGASLFNSRNITFEPNLRLATPSDYQLGTDDVLFIEVYGYSESSMQLRVSPEGSINIPYVGQVQVSGLSIEQAKKLITSKLTSIYTTIGSGTSVSVVLGNIRSIKIVMVGEVTRPGTYTLPSVATVFNALNAAGGPNRNGSFRKIKVVRNNKTIASVDIYDFLLTGELKNNVRLQDQDVIRIEPYLKRVELEGEVKNTGFFEAVGDETLANLITFAGGFANNAYKSRITVFRHTDKEKSVADVNYDQFGSFVLQDGDTYSVNKLLDRFSNRVQIEGAVFRPGSYALEDGMTVMKLIEKADGLREDAFMDRALVTRLKDDNTDEIIAFNLKNLKNGSEKDIVLRREDKLVIGSILEMTEKHNVSIMGEVKYEGDYQYYQNMSLKDLVFQAGGFKDKAELRSIEVARIVKDADVLRTGNEISRRYTFTVDRNLEFSNGGDEFLLEPDDQIIIRQISGYTSAQKVMLEGEVYQPGSYMILSKSDKISDLIKRAGGVTSYGYPAGAFLIRRSKLSFAEEKLEGEVLKGVVSKDQIISQNKFLQRDGIVGINLDRILKQPGSKWDLLLEEGDVISVPRMLQTVQVAGEVLLPAHVRFDPSNSFKSYISNSGGFTSEALRRKAFVVHANGTAEATKSFLFIRKYPSVTPGAKIYVPQKPVRNRLTTGEILSIGTSVVSLATMITILVTQLNK